ncbi:retrovirus-related Pol polyprotein from transposon TNT 1-94 [Trifolium pratense]|uniref:Retrovirus-related Pol polyprotein from transposon TNT 1-94 n=1 Tax=Trifolium pratense TaxID=57577 RepID=A0A2K3LN00_TRIPR|nr:retrovirus-related Pol polyprotein from transposon TNT 1-94 [Trifolium pratense]
MWRIDSTEGVNVALQHERMKYFACFHLVLEVSSDGALAIHDGESHIFGRTLQESLLCIRLCLEECRTRWSNIGQQMQSEFDMKSGDDKKSTYGGCFFLENNLISWFIKKQKSVSLSTAEVEYIAAESSCSQLLWMNQVLKEYNVEHNIASSRKPVSKSIIQSPQLDEVKDQPDGGLEYLSFECGERN